MENNAVSSLSRSLKRTFDAPVVWSDRIQATMLIPKSQLGNVKDMKHWYVNLLLTTEISSIESATDQTWTKPELCLALSGSSTRCVSHPIAALSSQCLRRIGTHDILHSN